MRTTRRGGFTLFQLLSLLALLGLLFALLVPAIAKVRQSAARAQSTNNLKQIAIACHNYHDTFQTFPSGNDKNNFSAAAHLLPYIEQANLYQTLDFKKSIDDPANATGRKAQVKVFMSPLDPQPIVGADGVTNYLFNAGPEPALADNKGGVFYQDSKMGLAQIAGGDGTSNTIMIGETLRGDGGKKAVDVHRQYVLLGKEALGRLKPESGVQEFKDSKHITGDRGFRWIDGRFLEGTFTGTRAPGDMRPDVSAAGMGGLSALRTLEPVVLVAMCDGSTRMVSPTISAEVWKNLCAWNDGQVIPPEVFK
jgi:hypothetical protein